MYARRLVASFFVLLIQALLFLATCRSTARPVEEEAIRRLPPHKMQKDRRPLPGDEGYRLHENITATCFFIGEYEAGSFFILDNRASAWTGRWVDVYGDIDHPEKRDGFFPEGFVPGENPFYCALPYNDLTADGYKENAREVIPWAAEGTSADDVSAEKKQWPHSYCKNRWILVQHDDRVCYAQWEDVGPFETDDCRYVFGEAPPKNTHNGGAGLDLSPACFAYLGISGSGVVDWRFVTFEEVPDGPWKAIVTTSEPSWE
ncbi:MAG: hypothetical protein JXQ30_01400 [Spirochaetes bacterium]|nr:hypothetical protein [Spirochaetota bacterium]